jgi:hypothetical protein
MDEVEIMPGLTAEIADAADIEDRVRAKMANPGFVRALSAEFCEEHFGCAEVYEWNEGADGEPQRRFVACVPFEALADFVRDYTLRLLDEG